MATSPLLEYFDNPATRKTVTGATWGAEVETHFVDEHGVPITIATTSMLLAARPTGPWQTTIDLGRQLIELIVEPQSSPESLVEKTLEGLQWLYFQAARLGAQPVFAPTIHWPGDLLWIQSERDTIWLALDGSRALEELCRVTSVQITVSVHPTDLVPTINAVWRSNLHLLDYAENNSAWQQYIAGSHAEYLPERYAGPNGFTDLADYASYLGRQQLVMYRGQTCKRSIDSISDLTTNDIDLFVRSCWPHYRARVFRAPSGRRVSAVEIRPVARRNDEAIATTINQVRKAMNL